LACIPLLAQSNSADAPVVREYSSLGFLGQLRGELLFNSKLRSHIELGYNSQEKYQLFNEVFQFYASGGIDANLSTHWKLGASGRFSRNFNNYANFLSKGYLGHTGKIGSLYFHKELSGELFTYGRIVNYRPPVQARLGLGFTVGKHWQNAKVPFYIQTALKVYTNKYFDSTLQFIYQQRFIDQTRLSIEGGARVSDWCWVSMYSLFDTRFYYTLSLFDVNGNAISPEARVNEIFPLLGIRLTFLFNHEKQEDYHPGLPLR
jgi:hypothetical protein